LIVDNVGAEFYINSKSLVKDKILIAFANSKEDELQNIRKEDEETN